MTNRTFNSVRFSRIAPLISLNANPKSFDDCKSSFHEARSREYLQEKDDLLFGFCREMLKKAYIFLQKDEGRFEDYRFLAEFAVEYCDDLPEIYIFALNGAFRNAKNNLENLSQTKNRHRLVEGFWEKINWEKDCKVRWEELGKELNNRIQELETQFS